MAMSLFALTGSAGAQSDPWVELQAQVNAGKLDQQVVDDLRANGSVNAVASLDDRQLLLDSLLRKLGRGISTDDDAEIANRIAAYALLKLQTLAPVGSGAAVLDNLSALGAQSLRFTSPQALLAYSRQQSVTAVRADRMNELFLSQSLALINQPAAATAGYTGAGTSVAVIDTGVDYRNTAFGGCSAPGGSCKVAYAQDFAPNDGSPDANGHGTNVAGIVLGVAPSARIISLDVFQGNGASDSWILSAINWVITNRATYNIASVNMSLGYADTWYTSTCTGSNYDSAFANLRSAGVLPVVAAGNDGFDSGVFKNGVSSPACAPGAVRVGAVYDANVGSRSWSSGCTDSTTSADKPTCFSQSAPILSLWAPGSTITAAGRCTSGTTCGTTVTYSGTSQATPHVAGAVAVLKSALGSASANTIESALVNNGPDINDTRSAMVSNPAKRRLDLNAAVNSLCSAGGCTTGGGGNPPPPPPPPPANPTPVLTSLSPATFSATTGGRTITVNGSNFRAGAVCYIDGVAVTTTYATQTRVRCTAPGSITRVTGQHTVRVANVGTPQSNQLTFNVTGGFGGFGTFSVP
jgi:subtilisin family serine protease